MKITFLGTGTSQGVPIIGCECDVCNSPDQKDKRLRSSVFIETQGLKFTIDAGPDFRYQMLRAEVKQLDAILITHGHKDHIGGLDDIRAFNYKMKQAMNVYAGTFAFPDLKREFYYAFEETDYLYAPDIKLIEVNKNSFNIQGIQIIPIEAKHHNKLVLGYRIGDFCYLTDAKSLDSSEKEKMKNAKIIVVNAIRKEVHHSHFNLEEALSLIEELQPKKAYLTHLSHWMGLHEEVSKELPDNVFIAYDGLVLNT